MIGILSPPALDSSLVTRDALSLPPKGVLHPCRRPVAPHLDNAVGLLAGVDHPPAATGCPDARHGLPRRGVGLCHSAVRSA